MKTNLWKLATVLVAGLFSLMVCGSGFAAKGGIPGPPTGGETPNNLSVPGILTESVNSIVANWSTPAEPVLGVHYSCGCDQGEMNGSFSYPNTSCVDNLDVPGTYYTAEQCVAEGAPCAGLEVSRIYWQKVDVNEWWADDDGISPDPGYVAYVDWGDALEAVSWTERSVIRVETQPYSSTIDDYLPWVNSCYDAAVAASLDPAVVCKVGLQMWHVSGQGITEHWGVRASDEEGELTPATSYNYDSPFQIIKSTNARLNLTKMEPLDALCAQPGEGGEGDEPPVLPSESWNGSEWAGTCTYSDAPYSVETSVGGKYVYGYNLRMGDVELDSLCPGWVKTGFWRLTFYTPSAVADPAVIFDDVETPNVAPPAVPSEVRTLPREVFNTVLADPPPEPLPVTESEDPTADDRLYRPVVDTLNNLTYIDICIVAKTQGGGGGGGGGRGGGGRGK